MVGRTDSLGNAQENVYEGGSLLLKRPAGAAGWSLMVGAGSEPLSELGINPAGRAVRQSYFETDAQGSVVGVTDRSGAASGSSACADFGQPLSTCPLARGRDPFCPWTVGTIPADASR